MKTHELQDQPPVDPNSINFQVRKCKTSTYQQTYTIRTTRIWNILPGSITDKSNSLSNVYNMSGRVVSDIQTRAEGESLYIRYNTDANVVNNLKNDSSYKFIGEVILKINVV